jgi:predicted DNA-binding transcriptional regulator AlpA
MAREVSDFRIAFAHMDRSALVTADEFGELIGKSRNAVYHMLCREPDALPKPVFRQNRYVRWRAGDVRDWIDSLTVAQPRGIGGNARRGRPRNTKDGGASATDNCPVTA